MADVDIPYARKALTALALELPQSVHGEVHAIFSAALDEIEYMRRGAAQPIKLPELQPVSRHHPLVGHDVTVLEPNVPPRPHRIIDVQYSDHRGRWELLVLDTESHELRCVAAPRCQVLPVNSDRRTVVL